MTLEAEQEPIVAEVVNALLGILPDEWDAALLRLELTSYEGGVTGCKHAISSPAGLRDFVDPSDALYEATGNLAALFQRYGRPWKRATLRVASTSGEAWDYTIDFEY
jgi:hypothetical protein